MRILLVNPNRICSPAVPPIGLEYIAATLTRGGHETRILDLCFSSEVVPDIARAVHEFRPDIAGVTVRNIDSVLFQDNEFYLDGIRDIIRVLKSAYGLKVIVGGAAIAANPEGIIAYLDADAGIDGPAEDCVNAIMRAVYHGIMPKQVQRGNITNSLAGERNSLSVDYKRYYEAGGIAGFETHKGCSSSCVYCIEANSPVFFRRPESIIREIRDIADLGFTQFHLCDAEFNEDLDHSLAFCESLKRSGTGITWAVYMKPANYNQKLFRLMRETGVNLITLTVDSFRKCPLYWEDTEKMIFSAKSNDIRLAVDFLTGFPYEDENLLKWCLDFFRRIRPDRVNINTYIRLYKSLAISRIIERDAQLKEYIIGSVHDESMIMPMFYSQIAQERLKELVAEDALFRIEGIEKGVNYMRCRNINNLISVQNG